MCERDTEAARWEHRVRVWKSVNLLNFNLSATVVSLRTLQSTHRFINETPRINSVSQSHSHSKANIVRRGKMWSNSVRSPPRKEEQTHDSDTRFSALIIICKSHSTVLKCYIWNKRRKTMFSNTKLCFVFGLSVKYWTLFTHFYPWTVIWKELFQKFRRDNVSFSFFFFLDPKCKHGGQRSLKESIMRIRGFTGE